MTDAKRYTVATQGWVNDGLGWERDNDDDLSLMTKAELEAYAASRDAECISLEIYEDTDHADEPVAVVSRGTRAILWF